MTPNTYLAEIVLPSAREFLDARGNRRLAYLACISTFHLCDYIARADGVSIGEARKPIRTRCEPSFDVVEGICNGSKHCGRDGRGAFDHTPGAERDVRPFGFGPECAGWDEGRWGHAGLEVEHAGQRCFIDACLTTFLNSAADAYPAHLAAAKGFPDAATMAAIGG